MQPGYPFPESQMNFPGGPCSNGLGSQSQSGGNESLSPAQAAVAAVVRQQMQMAASAGYHPDVTSGFSLPSHLGSSANNGGSASCIPMPKLGSPATSSQNNGSGGLQMPRLASPAIPGLPSSMHGLSGLSNLHMMQGMGGHLSGSGHSSHNPGITITPAHGSSSSTNDGISSRSMSNSTQSLANAMAQLSSPASMGSNSAAMNMHRMSSPAGSIHDLRITSPDDMHGMGGGGGSSGGGGRGMHSPLDALENSGLNLAVSSMAYKAARGYTASPRSDLFHDDLSDFMNAQRSASRLSGYKDPSSSSIKMEPMTDCRGD